MNKSYLSFIGCDSEYNEAKTVIFGAPFDSTTSYRPGTRFAGKAIRNECYGIETYSPYQDKDLEDVKIFDAGDLDLSFGNPKRTLGEIEAFTSKIFEDGKTPCMIGGEHLVSLGAIKAALKKYPDLCIIQFDAHADLRDDYLNENLSHACILRRVWDLVGDGRIFQFGIRSGTREEFKWSDSHTHMQKFNFNGLDKIIENLKNKPVYFTLDLDVLDVSVFPGTGTPEGGGVSFSELLDACLKLSKLDIIGFDINELSPMLDHSGGSTAIACKILRELLLAFYKD